MTATREPDFERLRTALMLEGEPDCVPILEGTVEVEVMEAFLGHPIDNFYDEVEFWSKAGFDAMPMTMGFRQLMSPGLLKTAGKNFLWEARKSISSDYSVYDDPSRKRAWAKEDVGLITSQKDFDDFPWPSPNDFDYSRLADFQKFSAPRMKPIPVLGNIFTMAWELMGMETFFLALHDEPALAVGLINKVAEIQDKALEICLSYDNIGAIWMSEDLGSKTNLLVSPKFLKSFVFPWYEKWGMLCKKRGLPYMLHSDGKVDRVIEDIIRCGFNALHPIEPLAMDIVEIKHKYGDYLCLIGNIDLEYTLTRGTPKEVEDITRERIRVLAPGGGYCVASSNSITEYVPLKNFLAMRDAAFQYGKYPICA
jgi:uroporphyrinogen decarboxylase